MASGRKEDHRSDICWSQITSQEVIIRTYMIRIHQIILYMNEWSLLQTIEPLHYGEAYLPATCLPAYLLLALLPNNHLPHAAGLKSFRNHIRLIDKGHTPIYRNIKQSQRQRIRPQLKLHTYTAAATYSSHYSYVDQQANRQGFRMTRTSFFVVFVGNCYGSDMCSPAPSLGAGITLFQSRISSSQQHFQSIKQSIPP